jgi:hypothetical protein
MEGKWVHFGSVFSTVSSNSSRFGCNQFCKIVCMILTSFQILSIVAHTTHRSSLSPCRVRASQENGTGPLPMNGDDRGM